MSDHIFGVTRSNFAAAWDELSTEREETYALSNANTIPEAVKNIVDFLGMHPCDRTDRVPEGKSSHAVALAGNVLSQPADFKILEILLPDLNHLNVKYATNG